MNQPNLKDYDVILINTSAGKDSQAMLHYVQEKAVAQGLAHRLVAVHADLGRVEWKRTRELAEEQAAYYEIRFIAIARPQGDLLAQIEERGMWPSSTARYCTSDHKRGQVQKVITMLGREILQKQSTVKILSCMGFRAEESPARAKKNSFERNERASTTKRTVDTWLPILDWLEPEVWETNRRAGTRSHPAYELGMPRLSCIFCIFAPKSALIIAGRANPELLDEYVALEEKMGHTFRKDFKIAEIKEAIERGETGVGKISGAWNM